MSKTGFKCKLRVILVIKDWKIGEFAKRVDVSPAAMSSIINDHSLPSFKVAYRICEELNTSLNNIWIKIDEKEQEVK